MGRTAKMSQEKQIAQNCTENTHPRTKTQNSIAFHESLTLSNRDRDIVLSTLENPPELTETLKSAIRRFRNKYAK